MRERLKQWLSSLRKRISLRWMWIVISPLAIAFIKDLFRDRLIGATNTFIDQRGTSWLFSLRPVLIYLVESPIALAAITLIFVILILIVHAYFDTRSPGPGLRIVAYGEVSPPINQPNSAMLQTRALSTIPVRREPKPPSIPPAADTGVLQSGKHKLVNVTPEHLTGLFKGGHTSIQAKKLTEAFIGKWIKISGLVDDVLGSTNHFRQVTFKERSIFSQNLVLMYFRPAWFDQISTLKPGDNITVIGQITDVTSQDIHLDNCELVDS